MANRCGFLFKGINQHSRHTIEHNYRTPHPDVTTTTRYSLLHKRRHLSTFYLPTCRTRISPSPIWRSTYPNRNSLSSGHIKPIQLNHKKRATAVRWPLSFKRTNKVYFTISKRTTRVSPSVLVTRTKYKPLGKAEVFI